MTIGRVSISGLATGLLVLTVLGAAKGADLEVEFQGGVIGNNMAAVLEQATAVDGVVQTRTVTRTQGEGLCQLLQEEISLEAHNCTQPLVNEIATINARRGISFDPNGIPANTPIVLPDLKAETFQFKRLYDSTAPLDKGPTIKNNSEWQRITTDSFIPDDAPYAQVDTYKGVRWTLKTDVSSSDVQSLAWLLTGPNVSARPAVQPETSEQVTLWSGTPDDHFNRWCVEKRTDDPEADFQSLLSSLYDTSGAVSCSAAPADVAILDLPIEPVFDLAGSLGKPPQAPLSQCVASNFDQHRDHGMMMATIIGSAKNNVGFAGVSPAVRFRPFEWSNNENSLQQFIRDNVTETPPIFVFASKFLPFARPDASTPFAQKATDLIWQHKDDGSYGPGLATAESRFQKPLNKEILNAGGALFVVAAGQNQTDGSIIDPTLDLSPQNLGDLPNVLVVGACRDCKNSAAALWPRSNYSKPLVQVLAPGDSEIPTYLSDGTIGETVGGTSASSAFVAGLAARMKGCYPGSYYLPKFLKQRIVVTSRPVMDEDTAARVAGGPIDPSVAMLDPAKDWLATTDGTVRPVTFSHWCDKGVSLNPDDDGEKYALSRRLLRLTRADGSKFVASASPSGGEQTGMVDRIGPGSLKPNLTIATVIDQSGQACGVNSDTLLDFLLHALSSELKDCTPDLPPC